MTSEPDTSAVRAFEALRAEVAATRAELRELAEVTAGKTMPDYDLTLGRIAQQLGDMCSEPQSSATRIAIIGLPRPESLQRA